MSAGHIALLIALFVALVGVLVMLVGSMARSMASDRLPRGAEPADVLRLGHRAARWTSAILLVGVFVMVVLDELTA